MKFYSGVKTRLQKDTYFCRFKVGALHTYVFVSAGVPSVTLFSTGDKFVGWGTFANKLHCALQTM